MYYKMYESVVLGFGLILFFLTWISPLAYGRFHDVFDLPFKLLNNRLYITASNLPALVSIIVYTIDKEVTNLGAILYGFIVSHFVLRTIIVPLIISQMYTSDTKTVSLIVPLVTGTYNAFVGISLAHMCVAIDDAIDSSWLNIPILIGAGVCLCLNIYYDLRVNYLRCYDEEVKPKDSYLRLEDLENEFDLLFALGVSSPNYFFEMIEWSLIALVSWHTESIAYMISTILILWGRALNIDRWLSNN